jgi:glycosyltransferase involved in cell wall biosynthesis
MDQVIVCGGILVAFEHCKGLRGRGYDAFIIADWGTIPGYDVPIWPLNRLRDLEDEDVIVSVWHPQMHLLDKFKGRKIQLSQDCMEDIISMPEQVIKDTRMARHSMGWEMIAVSKYAGDWTGCNYTLIPNGINDRFFIKHDEVRNIDVLIEGNDDGNKGIPDAMEIAQSIGGIRIGWLARVTRLGFWTEFQNPPQEDIPKIYQRAKVVIKCSHSEGFGLPHLEAMASGCVLLTYNSGGNYFCIDGVNCFMGDKEYLKMRLKEILEGKNVDDIIKNAKETANKFKWEKSIDKLCTFVEKRVKI